MSCPITFLDMTRYRKLLIALAAIASVYIIRETGLDAGLIDAALDGLIDAIAPAAEVAVEVAE